MCNNIIKHSFNENIKELIRLFVNYIVKWKIEIFYTFSTPRIFHTPHSSFSTEPSRRPSSRQEDRYLFKTSNSLPSADRAISVVNLLDR